MPVAGIKSNDDYLIEVPIVRLKVEEGEDYFVRAGDTPEKIARDAYDDPDMWHIIHEANLGVMGANPRNLKTGIRLFIPKRVMETAAPEAGKNIDRLRTKLSDEIEAFENNALHANFGRIANALSDLAATPGAGKEAGDSIAEACAFMNRRTDFQAVLNGDRLMEEAIKPLRSSLAAAVEKCGEDLFARLHERGGREEVKDVVKALLSTDSPAARTALRKAFSGISGDAGHVAFFIEAMNEASVEMERELHLRLEGVNSDADAGGIALGLLTDAALKIPLVGEVFGMVASSSNKHRLQRYDAIMAQVKLLTEEMSAKAGHGAWDLK